jgi:hypothetical protein
MWRAAGRCTFERALAAAERAGRTSSFALGPFALGLYLTLGLLTLGHGPVMAQPNAGSRPTDAQSARARDAAELPSVVRALIRGVGATKLAGEAVLHAAGRDVELVVGLERADPGLYSIALAEPGACGALEPMSMRAPPRARSFGAEGSHATITLAQATADAGIIGTGGGAVAAQGGAAGNAGDGGAGGATDGGTSAAGTAGGAGPGGSPTVEREIEADDPGASPTGPPVAVFSPGTDTATTSAAANPSAANPSAANPSAANPSAANPSAANPSAANPSAANPSAANPSAAVRARAADDPLDRSRTDGGTPGPDAGARARDGGTSGNDGGGSAGDAGAASDGRVPSGTRASSAREPTSDRIPPRPPPRRGASGAGLELEQLGWVLVGSDGFGYLETRLTPAELTAVSSSDRREVEPAVRTVPRARRALDRVESRALIIQRLPTRDGDPAAYDIVACGIIDAPDPTEAPTS